MELKDKKHTLIFVEASDFIEDEIKSYAMAFMPMDEIFLPDSFIDYLLKSVIDSKSVDKDVFNELISDLYKAYDKQDFSDISSILREFFKGLKDDLKMYTDKLAQGVLYDLKEDMEEMKKLRSEIL